ncbi:MAG: DedA family protein [Candidatus Levyibacteriota bacterium]|nr:MAG: DedA family protein [Candidatus Levybacteria bacterium]
MLETLSTLITQFIHTTGYFGIFLLMTLESALIPIPSEVTMPFAGFLASKGDMSLWIVIFIGAIGNLVGSWIAYGLGYFLEETVIVSLIKRYGKFILITEHEYQQSRHWFNKYGNSIAFFSRVLPAVRTFISLPAGLSQMNIWKFSFYTFTGSLIWSTFLTFVGFYLGENWHSLEPYYRKFEYVIAGIFIAGGLWYINRKLKIITFWRT